MVTEVTAFHLWDKHYAKNPNTTSHSVIRHTPTGYNVVHGVNARWPVPYDTYSG
jgi:hypothetical protein